ncbi:MAG: CFI-box-CTERM domain-containing protein [Candidatus Woesearchaeota archaeon]
MGEKEDKEYKRGVEEGQKGNIFSDIGKGGPATNPYDKGYKEGAEHRYNPEGKRYHDWDGSGVNDGDSSSDEDCCLTTACVEAMGLPDNCLELTTLRGFRDNYVLKTPEGKAAVRIYYAVAPRVVKAINARADRKQIWKRVYADVQKAVTLINSGKLEEACKHYCDTGYLRLCAEYLG